MTLTGVIAFDQLDEDVFEAGALEAVGVENEAAGDDQSRKLAAGAGLVAGDDAEAVGERADGGDEVGGGEVGGEAGRVTLDIDAEDGAGVAVAQPLDGGVHQELALVDDADGGADAVDVVEDVGGHEDGLVAAERADDLEDLAAAHGIEVVDGLVEDEDLRVAHERGGEGEALLHAAGVAGDFAAGGDGDPLRGRRRDGLHDGCFVDVLAERLSRCLDHRLHQFVGDRRVELLRGLDSRLQEVHAGPLSPTGYQPDNLTARSRVGHYVYAFDPPDLLDHAGPSA